MIKTQPILQGIHLVRAFDEGERKTLALREVSLKLYPGQVGLLMGPSGSGKSTLLAVLSGLLKPDRGKVFALGQDLWAMSEPKREEFRRRHCGFIFQGYNLFPALTARQQLELVLTLGERATAREARRRAEKILYLLDLAGKAHLRPAQLSGGEKQRVALGRALIKAPTFCFADEPTSALDWANGEHVVELLRLAAHDEGAAVLIVSHDARLVPYADRIFHLEDGRLAKTSRRAGLSAHRQESALATAGKDGESIPASIPRRGSRSARRLLLHTLPLLARES
jgi:putative ABC transport system ATP-binding protein